MIVLGIDPGTRFLGWGVVERSGNRLSHISHGVISLDGKRPLAERLCRLEQELCAVVSRFEPAVGSVETLFFHKDAQAAAKLGHARGVVLLVLARAGVALAEYAPAKVKRTITGRGQADKKQVAMMIRAVLSLSEFPRADATDALALAVTHHRLGGLSSGLATHPKLAGVLQRDPAALTRLLSGRGRKRRTG